MQVAGNTLLMFIMENNFSNPVIYENLGCTLQISGVGFNADEYLSESHFKQEDILFNDILGLPDEIRAKIEKDQSYEAKASRVFDSKYLLISVSRKTDIISQTEDAISFLKKYRTELKKLQLHPDIEMIAMRFSSEKNENLFNFADFSPEFHDLVFEAGIESVMFG